MLYCTQFKITLGFSLNLEKKIFTSSSIFIVILLSCVNEARSPNLRAKTEMLLLLEFSSSHLVAT